MSPNVGNFVHDLVEMAKAMETLPQVEAERDRLNAALNEALVRVENREVSILTLKAEIETLNTKVRETEASRDSAEMMFLELDEKASSVTRLLLSIRNLAEDGEASLNPPKPQPMPERVAQPITSQAEPVYTSSGFEAQPVAVPEPVVQSASEVPTSEVNPQNASMTNISSSETVDTAQTDVLTSTLQNKPSGPYSGLRYHDHPTYVPFDQWIAGGGSEEDYHWRPNNERKTF